MKLISKRLFTESTENGALLSIAFYSNNNGRIMNYITKIKKSDTFCDSIIRLSNDNLETFYKTYEDKTSWPVDNGMMTKYFKVQVIDPKRDRLYMFYNQGVLPGNNPGEGVKNWQMYYAMSEDGGETTEFYEPIIMEGEEFDITHPIEGVFQGKNSFMVGDYPCTPIILNDGKTILLAVQTAVLDEAGNLYNPYGAFTYQSSSVLHGAINDDGRISWVSLSNQMLAATSQSTRGTLEPCLCQIAEHRLLMICRGSNDNNETLPGYRWCCYSDDLGRTFKGPFPWTYTDGEKFYSPSSCSQLLKHSNGKVYWIGNICEENSRGNMPRNPLYIVEVDKKTMLLKKDTRFMVAKRQENDYRDITFSNFYGREERETGDILIYCTALWLSPDNPMESKGSDEYRIAIK